MFCLLTQRHLLTNFVALLTGPKETNREMISKRIDEEDDKANKFS